MKPYFAIIVLSLMCTIIFAQKKLQHQQSYPGGSPFPPGKTPSLTHMVTAYWTTLGGMTTDIQIRAEGNRATQFSCWRMAEEKEEHVSSSISSNCRYHILISQEKQTIVEGITGIASLGHGGLKVNVYGFKQEDFQNPPIVIVSYLKDGQLIGETRVTAQAVPENLK